MTIPSKGTRNIKVGEKTYRWRLNNVRQHEIKGAFLIENAQANLVVETPEGKVWTTTIDLKKWWDDSLDPIPITPRRVKAFIEGRLEAEDE